MSAVQSSSRGCMAQLPLAATPPTQSVAPRGQVELLGTALSEKKFPVRQTAPK
jgi:hypothetical protein